MPPVIQFLARTIDIIASADRGAYDESLADLRTVSRLVRNGASGREAAAPSLDTSALLAICEAYYQRLLQGDRFDVAQEGLSNVAQGRANPRRQAVRQSTGSTSST